MFYIDIEIKLTQPKQRISTRNKLKTNTVKNIKNKSNVNNKGYNTKSLRGRVDSSFFSLIQLLFLIQFGIGIGLIIILIIDSAWAGFPLYISIVIICFIIFLDYSIMYNLAWTRWIYQMELMLNISTIILIIQTISNGYGQLLTLFGLIFVSMLIVKLFLMYKFKSKLIGNRKQGVKK